MASMIRVALERQGYDIYCSDCGTRGVEEVYGFLPHLILLDMMMPLMDGFKVIETMSAHAALKERPIVCLTALVDYRSIRRAFASGARGYIFKPVNLPVLFAVLSFLTSPATREEKVERLMSVEPFREVAEATRGVVDSLLKLELVRLLGARKWGVSASEAAATLQEPAGPVAEALAELARRGVVGGSEDRFKLAFDRSGRHHPAALVATDPDRRVCFVNLLSFGLLDSSSPD